ncbi:MAG: tRNA (adenosine(37)-N6)-dimethylallyltransferase MiaA [Hydrotalea sp.]|nr:tRNA (adenosine(37)-N6)-dimethylallyltransferase MiaA [Hydrotalea sp.]
MTGDIIIIYGATASGKSQLALDMAKKITAAGKQPVIINADALQQYRDLPLLSAQPSADDKKTYPHLLYGFLNPSDESNVASWLNLAISDIKKTIADGSIPIVVGGSGLYIKTLIAGISQMPTVPAEVKKTMIQSAATNPAILQDYYRELTMVDPPLAGKLPRHDATRIIRGLSVFRATGKPLSVWQSTAPRGGLLELFPDKKISYHYVEWPRAVLLQHITRRTEQIIANGADNAVVGEYKRFMANHPHDGNSLPIHKTIGADAVADYIQQKIDLQQLQERIIIETRQYAKRQVTWYRGQLQRFFTD